MAPLPSERVRPLLSPCRLCEVRCGVDRLAGERGPCGVGLDARTYNAFVHLGEESELVPCFTVFLTGCNLRCVFCSDGEAVDDPEVGMVLAPAALARRVAELPDLRSVEFVGGLPDVNLYAVARCAEQLPPDLPVALNTNGWFTPEALEAMVGWVDWLVVDLKYGPGPCAADLAGVDGYWPLVTANLRRARGRFSVIVRHLLLPGHVECCTRPALRWLAEELPDVRVNVMTGYRPLHRVAGTGGPLDRTVRDEEVRRVLATEEARALRRLVLDGRPPYS